MSELHSLTLKQAIEHANKSGAADLVTSLKNRAQKLNPSVNAFIGLENTSLVSGAASGVLAGVPIAVKDNICVEGQETTCASKILKGHVPPYDAHVIQKLKGAGASIYGRCNMDEFAFGSSCETSTYGPSKNPWNLNCVPGGSSGGSAASVAADMAYAALGSDTGGSIRQPAALCGLVGLKPTYGRVSRNGLIAFGSSFDQIGPITKTVEDSAILLNVLAGHDAMDSTSANVPVPDYTKNLNASIKGLKIGLPKEFFPKDSAGGMDKDVEKSVREAVEVLKGLGAEVKEISLPHVQYSVEVYYIVAVAEASSNLGRFDGVRYGARAAAKDLNEVYFASRSAGFGQEAKRRILLGTFVLSAGYYEAYYLKGQKVRTLIRNDFDNAFKEVDVILSPTSPCAAFKIGEKSSDPLAMYLSDIYTIPANLAGIPALSVPCGFTAAGLPIGLQLMGRAFEEETILRMAHQYEQKTQFYKKKPAL